MKIVKDLEQGLLLNYYWQAGAYRLAVSLLCFFDFDQPDAPLPESDMYRFLDSALGKDAVLDAGMPKLRGEALLKARCHQPGHEPQPESYATVRVGALVKTVRVFGARYWRNGPDGYVASAPDPFLEMDLGWENAFGGPGYAQNPVGMGLAPVPGPSPTADDTAPLWPLPHVEAVEQPILSPADRPEPASFAPLAPARPSRAAKRGVYDRAWFAQRWPHFPADMDWSFFNVAPENQQREGFFQPGDPIGLGNMHPKLPVLATQLPALRQRIFANRLGLRADGTLGAVFGEIPAVIDTVWLFPEAKRGVAIWRAALDVADDEASDVQHLYLATENANSPAQTDEDAHRAAFEKRIDRVVAIDPAPLDAARAALERSLEEVKDLPLAIDAALDKALGATPDLDANPEAVGERAAACIDQGLERFEQALRQLTQVNNSRVKVPPTMIEAVRTGLRTAKIEIDRTVRRGRETVDALRRTKERLLGECAGVSREAGADADLAALFPATDAGRWQVQAAAFLAASQRCLRERPEVLDALRKLGIRPATAAYGLLGYNPEPLTVDAAWGLPDSQVKDVLPQGLVIPRWRGRRFTAIVIRPGDFADASSDAFAPGSTNAPLLLGQAAGRPVARVADVLEAWRLFQDCREQVAVLACPEPGPRFIVASASLVKATRLLVILYATAAERLDAEFLAWQRWHTHVEPLFLPVGRNVFEAAAQDCDLAAWIGQALQHETGQAPASSKAATRASVCLTPAPLPGAQVYDADMLYNLVKEKLATSVGPRLDLLDKERARAVAAVGLRAPQSAAPRDEPLGFAGIDPAAIFGGVRDGLDRLDALAVLAKQESRASALLRAAQSRLDKGAAHAAILTPASYADARAPEWARRLRQELGLLCETETGLDRAAVQERCAAGRSLAGAHLAGLDLSGLDLRKADLRRANLCGARCVGTVFDGADLSQAIAEDADFSQASLRGAVLAKSVLARVRCVEADLTGADLSDALCNGADLRGANLSRATLVGAAFDNATLVQADCREVEARLAVFHKTDASGLKASGGRFAKAFFLDVTLEQADFSSVTTDAATLWSVRATGLQCREARLVNLRVGGDSVLRQATFSLANLERACVFDTDLREADFRSCQMQRALFDRCAMSGANFSKIAGRDARIDNCALDNVSLRGANLMYGSLRKSRIKSVDVRGANFYGADLYMTQTSDVATTAANLTRTLKDPLAGVDETS